MRLPSEVAGQIRDVVPEEHKERFTRLMSDFSYMAPELMGLCWARLSRLCNEFIPAGPVEEWQVEMIAILTHKEDL